MAALLDVESHPRGSAASLGAPSSTSPALELNTRAVHGGKLVYIAASNATDGLSLCLQSYSYLHWMF